MDDWKKYGLRSNKNDDGGPMENMGSHSSEQETIRPNNGRMPPVESTTTCIPKHCKPTLGFGWEVPLPLALSDLNQELGSARVYFSNFKAKSCKSELHQKIEKLNCKIL